MGQQNSAVITVQEQVKINKDLLKKNLNADSVLQQFRNVLKENAGAFVASIIEIYNTDTKLQMCTPNSVITEALKAASMKLPISKALGFSYLLPFEKPVKIKDEEGRDQWSKVVIPTFIVGYKGYIQLAMRTGQYRLINADYVFEGELKKRNKLTGEIAFDGEKVSDKVVGYFAHFELLNGFTKTQYMTTEEMATYAKRYSPTLKNNKNFTVAKLEAMAQEAGQGVGWTGNFGAMALKTVIRQLLMKYGYLSIEMENAISNEVAAEEAQSRDAIIAEGANTEVVNIEDVEYENVNTETGEVTPTTEDTETEAEQTAKQSEFPY